MKVACTILGTIVAGACFAEPGVQAVLTGVRCIYASPHDESGCRMELQVELRPTEQDWQVNEAGSRTLRIHGSDQLGNSHTSAPCVWERCSARPNSCIAHFLFPLLSKVEYLQVNESLQVQIARQALRLPQREVSMLQQGSLMVPGLAEPIRCIPDDSNASPDNLCAVAASLFIVLAASASSVSAVSGWQTPLLPGSNRFFPPISITLIPRTSRCAIPSIPVVKAALPSCCGMLCPPNAWKWKSVVINTVCECR